MVFSELRFFVFLAVVFAIHWLLKSFPLRKLWLLAASYFFYSVWDWRFSFLILGSTIIDYFVGRKLHQSEEAGPRKRWLWLSLVVNLGLLGVFKYFNFFADSLVDASRMFGFELSRVTVDILLPVGISFYTFQTMSYSLDIYRRKLEPVGSFTDFALFVAFFPQLVAGPIVRAIDFLPQLKKPGRWEDIRFQPLVALFLVGFFKKACVSDNISVYVDACFNAPETFNAASLWLGVVLYAIQIYCDFSGYSDMAIAVAGMLGFTLPLNFDAPYLAAGITDFWRRWHISLSSWLRDYLYIPLGGNRLGETRTYFNLMTTMVLGGLWHGASWNFVLWGALHGGALAVAKSVGDKGPLKIFRSPILAWALTFWWVCLAWILFRADNLKDGLTVARAWAFGVGSGTDTLPSVVWIHVVVLAIIHVASYRFRKLQIGERVPGVVFSFGAGVSLAVMLAIASNDHQPFIYFQF